MLKYKLKNFSRYVRSKLISDEAFTKNNYFKKFGRHLDFNNPQTFNEKINVMKTNDTSYDLAPYVDKFKVREYVKNTIGEKYLVDLICVSDTFDRELFDSLPSQFILKTVNGSAMNYLCKNKSDDDYHKIKKCLGKWLSLNPYLRAREKQYRYVDSRFVIEKLMTSDTGEVPVDYKFHCFNGKIKFITAATSRFTKDYNITVFDENGDALPVDYITARDQEYKHIDINLEEFRPIVEKLSSSFKFVRVDLYYFQNQIKFGELTFTPMNGLAPFTPTSFDYEFGKLLDISKDTSFFVS